MPYAAVESNFSKAAAAESSFYQAAAERASATGGNSSYTAGPGGRQHHENFSEVVERRDPHGLPGHPACKARTRSTAASATFVPSHPTSTTGLIRPDHQQHQRHDPAMLLGRMVGAESGLRSQSAIQGERLCVCCVQWRQISDPTACGKTAARSLDYL